MTTPSAPTPRASALQLLPDAVAQSIRSHFLILNAACAIEECLTNSIDAGATQIHVKLVLEDCGFRFCASSLLCLQSCVAPVTLHHATHSHTLTHNTAYCLA